MPVLIFLYEHIEASLLVFLHNILCSVKFTESCFDSPLKSMNCFLQLSDEIY